MEPEEPYIPYEDRTPKELCRDIMFKAEKLYIKDGKRDMLIGASVILILAAIAWYNKESFNQLSDYSFFTWLGVFAVVYFVFFFINRKLIHDMELAANPRQFLSMVQRLNKSVKLRKFLTIAIGIWPALQLTGFVKVVWWYAAALIPAFIVAWIVVSANPEKLVDSEFYDDVEELEYQLNK